jgi:DNA-binding NarL/FixJ family response regulator
MNTTATKRRVLLVEDHPLFRERIGMLINKDLGMEICGETDNIKDAMTIIQSRKPDIAIVDINLRGSSGLELVKDIKAQGLKVAVLILSMHEESVYAERALRAGARGYIMKSEAPSEVVQAIRQITDGGVYVSQAMNSQLLKRLSRTRAPETLGGVDTLTDRELEVFQLIGRGKNAREIAAELHLGETTIETYRGRIKDKLGVKNAAGLYQRATQWLMEREK